SLGLCLFTSFALGAQDYADLYNAATGENLTAEQLLACGERIWNNERLFNLQEGYTAQDDTLPRRLLEEPIPDGPSKGSVHRLAE
ncbi:aldehyde ferredoxin oxidoreductase C-terminal domain-containing protein, partial [Carboxydocella sp. ULO1]